MEIVKRNGVHILLSILLLIPLFIGCTTTRYGSLTPHSLKDSREEGELREREARNLYVLFKNQVLNKEYAEAVANYWVLTDKFANTDFVRKLLTEINKDAIPALIGSGNQNYYLGKYEQAASFYRVALNLSSDKAEREELSKAIIVLYLKVGDSYYKDGKYGEALTTYQKVIAEFPKDENTRLAEKRILACLYTNTSNNAEVLFDTLSLFKKQLFDIKDISPGTFRLLREKGGFPGLVLSPDGQKLLFRVWRKGEEEIFMLRRNERKEVNLFKAKEIASLEWAPDSTWVAIVASSKPNRYTIWLVDTDRLSKVKVAEEMFKPGLGTEIASLNWLNNMSGLVYSFNRDRNSKRIIALSWTQPSSEKKRIH